jgi:hypothetical protein
MKRIAVLVACAALGGCHHSARPCAPGAPARLELRDGAGALLAAVRPAEGGALELCTGDNAATLAGQVISDGKVVTLVDASGALALRLSVGPTGDLQGSGAHEARLRVHRQGDAVRVLQPDGVPFGAIALSGKAAIVTDAASRPLATVAPSDGDEILTAPDGATRYHVVRAPSALAASAFALPKLSLPERLTLCLYWLLWSH